jgi:hypothetical protein
MLAQAKRRTLARGADRRLRLSNLLLRVHLEDLPRRAQPRPESAVAPRKLVLAQRQRSGLAAELAPHRLRVGTARPVLERLMQGLAEPRCSSFRERPVLCQRDQRPPARACQRVQPVLAAPRAEHAAGAAQLGPRSRGRAEPALQLPVKRLSAARSLDRGNARRARCAARHDRATAHATRRSCPARTHRALARSASRLALRPRARSSLALAQASRSLNLALDRASRSLSRTLLARPALLDLRALP